MNITRKIALALLLVALGVPSAFASMSGDAGGDASGTAANIEQNGDDAPVQWRFDQMLAVKVLDETALQRHARSAMRAPAPMEGHYVSNGSETPQLFGRHDLSQFVSYHAASEGVGDSAGLAQMSAVHMVGSGAVAGGAPLMSPAGSSTAQYVANPSSNGQSSVPLPPSFLLLASGLLGLPAIRLWKKQAC